MGQITIYLDAETENRLSSVVKKGGVSKSRWIPDLIKEKVSTSWPEKVAELAGSWSDLPTADEIRKGLARILKGNPYEIFN